MLLYKPILWTLTLMEETLTLALRGTEFDYQDESYRNSQNPFDHFRPSDFRCREPNALFLDQKYF